MQSPKAIGTFSSPIAINVMNLSSITKTNYTIILTCALLLGCSFGKKLNTNNPDKGWTSLFNGKDTKGWTVKINKHETGDNFGNTFRVVDGTIQVRYDEYGRFNDQFGHLYYNTPYSYFHLRFEYRFVGKLQPGAPSYTLRNSGVMFHSQDPRTMLKNQDWPISIEMQLLGGLSDGKPRHTGNMCSPGTDVVYKGRVSPDHCIDSRSKTYDGDQWVKAELIVQGSKLITHIIEGDTVLQYSKPTIGGGIVTGHDPKMKIDGKLLSSGYIALQSEGQPVDFRNIEIKVLPGKE